MDKNLVFRTKIYTAVIFSMLFWGFSFIWFKMANTVYKPISIIFLRLVIAVVLLTIFLWVTGSFRRMRVDRKDWRYFIILGFFEPFLYFLGESHGLTFVSSTAGSVMTATIPVFVVIGAWLLYGERLSLTNYLGVILSFAGVIIFIMNRDGSLAYNMAGILLMLLAVISAVGYSLTLRHLAGRYNPIFIVNLQNIIGLILFVPLFLIADLRDFLITPHSITAMVPILLLAVFASSGAFILFAYSVSHIGVSRSNVFTNCIPLFTAVFAYILLGETLTARNILGMAIAITGLFLSQLNGRKKHIKEAGILTGKTA